MWSRRVNAIYAQHYRSLAVPFYSWRYHSHSHGGSGHISEHHHGSELPPSKKTFLYVVPSALEDNTRGESLVACRRVTVAGFATNLIYSALKVGAGTAGNSISLIADGMHSLSDLAADAISYVSISITHRKYRRAVFPYGLGRFDTISSLIIALMLFSCGIALLISAAKRCTLLFPEGNWRSLILSGMDRILEKLHVHSHDSHHAEENASTDVVSVLSNSLYTNEKNANSTTIPTLLFLAMIGINTSSLVVKYILFRWGSRVGERTGSHIIVANAYHQLADSWTSGIALIGIAGQMYGIPAIDGICGAIVALMITRCGTFVLKNSLLELFDYQFEDVRRLAHELRALLGDDNCACHHHSAMEGNLLESKLDAHLVCVYATRHGHLYSIHCTFLMRTHKNGPFVEDALLAAEAQEALTQIAAQRLHSNVSEVEIQVLKVVPLHAEGRKGRESVEDIASRVAARTVDHETSSEYLDDVSLLHVFERLKGFYGEEALNFSKMFIDWETKELHVSCVHGCECGCVRWRSDIPWRDNLKQALCLDLHSACEMLGVRMRACESYDCSSEKTSDIETKTMLSTDYLQKV